MLGGQVKRDCTGFKTAVKGNDGKRTNPTRNLKTGFKCKNTKLLSENVSTEYCA